MDTPPNPKRPCVALKRASLHNNNSWSLPYDLTIKVFSMLDTKSVIRAASCCTMFQKWATEPSCYAHIDLKMAKNVTGEVMCNMIRRAGKELRSLKLVGGRRTSFLTTSGLFSLFIENVVDGDLLESLQLHKLGWIETKSLCDLLSACPNLIDLKIVDFVTFRRVNSNSSLKIVTLHTSLSDVLETLTRDNRISKLKHLFLEYTIKYSVSGIDSSTAEAFVTSCPDLTSLKLRGFEIEENIARKLIKGFPKLKYMNLSRPDNNYFLRSLGDIYRDIPSRH